MSVRSHTSEVCAWYNKANETLCRQGDKHMVDSNRPPRLADVYAANRAKEVEEEASRTKETPEWITNWAFSKLPANHPEKKRWLWSQLNPGVPYPESET